MPVLAFTERALQSLKPLPLTVEYYDTKTSGLTLRVLPTGKKTFYVVYRTGAPSQPAAERRLVRLKLGRYPELDLAAAREQVERYPSQPTWRAALARILLGAGQAGEARRVIEPLVAQLARDADYTRRRDAIAAFNASSPVIKRGLALTPVKFGISFTATFYNQAGALVHVYNDGTVLVSHGGTEMGQGLYTKIRQIVAQEFGLPVEDVRLSSTDTSRVPNTSATAASSGTDLNGKAAQAACQAIRGRIAGFVAERLGVSQDAVLFAAGQVSAPGFDAPFAAVVADAYRARVQLWDAGFYKTPKIHYDPVTMQGRPFFYFAYGASVSEVAIDTLTGESKVLRVDILHDVGRSINPALDIGQIEGGFIQGMGWLTTEELVYTDDGRLATHAPSTYKIPAISDLPRDFRVALFDNDNVEDSIHRSKAVGEPPLMLAFSVFFALRDAVAAALGPGARPRLDAPATPEAILKALNGGAL